MCTMHEICVAIHERICVRVVSNENVCECVYEWFAKCVSACVEADTKTHECYLGTANLI